MRTIIVASGQPNKGDTWRKWVRAGDRIIGADGGAARALAWGLAPDLVIGDLDSLSARQRKALEARGCPFLVHPRAKDDTDLELALTYAAEQGAQEIVILGALGGRLDHTLANLLLLALPQLAGRSVRLVDGLEEALLLRSGGRPSSRGSRATWSRSCPWTAMPAASRLPASPGRSRQAPSASPSAAALATR